jgi:ketosteroid isomerase-like protein
MAYEDLIRAVYRAWRGDDVEALLETLDPEIEFLTSGSFPDLEPVYRGHDGMRDFWEAMHAPWEWFRLDVERIVEGDDCAAVVIRFSARGRGSGVMMTGDLVQGQALWFRNGRVVKASSHASFEQALEAVGLAEEAHADS